MTWEDNNPGGSLKDTQYPPPSLLAGITNGNNNRDVGGEEEAAAELACSTESQLKQRIVELEETTIKLKMKKY